MGGIKRQRKKYSKPSKPWEKSRMGEESKLVKEYGFKNKKELWKINSLLNKFKEQAKEYVRETPENLKFRKELLQKVYSLSLVDKNAKVDDILGLNLKELLERRLQTIVYKAGLAMSIKQARQFITHGFIMIGDRKITSPSYIVKRGEESLLRINPNSKISSPDHPEILKIMNRNKVPKIEESEEEKPHKEGVAEKEAEKKSDAEKSKHKEEKKSNKSKKQDKGSKEKNKEKKHKEDKNKKAEVKNA